MGLDDLPKATCPAGEGAARPPPPHYPLGLSLSSCRSGVSARTLHLYLHCILKWLQGMLRFCWYLCLPLDCQHCRAKPPFSSIWVPAPLPAEEMGSQVSQGAGEGHHSLLDPANGLQSKFLKFPTGLEQIIIEGLKWLKHPASLPAESEAILTAVHAGGSVFLHHCHPEALPRGIWEFPCSPGVGAGSYLALKTWSLG